jgi:hypothetical protein
MSLCREFLKKLCIVLRMCFVPFRAFIFLFGRQSTLWVFVRLTISADTGNAYWLVVLIEDKVEDFLQHPVGFLNFINWLNLLQSLLGRRRCLRDR